MSRSQISKEIKYKDVGYRQVAALSYSQLACYAKSPYEYYKRYINGEEQEESDSLKLGQIVDVLTTDNSNFDKYFVISSATTPSPQLIQFCKFLLANSEMESFEDNLKKSYQELFEWNGNKLQKKYEPFIEFFYNEARDFYMEMLACKDKTLITIEEATLGEAIFKKYQEAKQFHCEGCTILTKVPIYSTILGESFKGEIDKLVINHKLKTVCIRDVKITSFLETFFNDGYLKRRYDIQHAVYKYLVRNWMQLNGYESYKLDNFSFECVDSQNRLLPLLYVCPDNYEQQTWDGFVYNGKYYKGIVQIIEELQESKKLDVWNISIKNLKNNGVVIMPTINND